jgi:hypothetical protein
MTGGATAMLLRDARLPQVGRLLDAEELAPLLERSLGRAAEVAEVRVTRVRYTPGEQVAVVYRALVDGEPHDAVARAVAGVDLAAKLGKPRYRALAELVGSRSPAAAPVTYADDLGATISWLPFDPGLPALALPSGLLLRRLRQAGVRISADAGEPVRTGYKPGARAVLRLGEHVLKAYGSDRRFRTASASLVVGSRSPALSTARFEASLAAVRLTVQAALAGSVPSTAKEVAEQAGALVRRLQRATPSRLRARRATAICETAARRAELTRTVVPELAGRLDRLVRRLEAELPPAGPLVPAHGDFHVDQLLVAGDDLHVIDLDELCLAPPEHDLASYAADTVRGRDDDPLALATVLPPLLASYGGEPYTLRWHLAAAILVRAPHPFLKFLPDWRCRIEGMVAAAELTLASEEL